MGSSDNKKQRWQKILDRSIRWHMLISLPLLRIFPMFVVLLAVLELIDGRREINMQLLISITIGKLLVAYFIGVYIGFLEWKFLYKLHNKGYSNLKNIRTNYIYIYGFLFFGMNFMLVQVTPFFDNSWLVLFMVIFYPLAGVLWGLLMWLITGNEFNKYVSNQAN